MANIKLLLKESIKHVGKVGDVVEVSAGYARNYLLPKDLAVQPTPGNVKKVEERRKEIERIEQEKRKDQAKLIEKLKEVEISLERKANENGHLFGSVSATDIAKALQAIGHDVQPDDVFLPGKLDRIDKFMVRIKFAEDLETEIKLFIAPDAESKVLMESASKARKEADAAAAPKEE